MNVAQYIESKPEFKDINFQLVYKVITVLIADGTLSISDLQKSKAVER